MISKSIALICLVLIGVSHPTDSWGVLLTPQQIVFRCYSHLTGERLPLDHTYRKNPPANESAALSICDSIIDSATLDAASGKVNNLEANVLGKKVLNNLYDFHRSWFGGDVFSGMQGFDSSHIKGTTDNFDSTEAALFMTYAAFNPNTRYEKILEGSSGVYALRTLDPVINSTIHQKDNNLPSRAFESQLLGATPPQILVKKDGATFVRRKLETMTIMDSLPVQIGELTGIVKDTRSLILPNYNPYTLRHVPGGKLNAESAISSPGFLTGFNLYENQGGGILGLNSFIFLNWGLETGVLQTGSVRMGRRWTEKVFNSLLCRDLPVLRGEDVTAYKATGNVSDFRKSTSCVSCHATMDQMASVGRNMLISGSDSDYAFNTTAKFTHVIGRTQATEDIGELWPTKDYPGYHFTKPKGRVMYRTVDGSLVNQSAGSFEEVGSILKSSPDLFKCATGRYFEFFTGIHLEFFDRGDPANQSRIEAESDETVEVRNYLDGLAAEFQAHQNVRTLMKNLIRSKFYKDSNYLKKE